jgi:hypothetical protein
MTTSTTSPRLKGIVRHHFRGFPIFSETSQTRAQTGSLRFVYWYGPGKDFLLEQVRFDAYDMLSLRRWEAVFHQIYEALEVVRGIVRARGCFGMILDRNYRKSFVAHTLNATVVKVDVGNLNVGR